MFSKEQLSDSSDKRNRNRTGKGMGNRNKNGTGNSVCEVLTFSEIKLLILFFKLD
jgi:hypothetical protein